MALREEYAISDPDGHRNYEARRQANMAVSTADVVAVATVDDALKWRRILPEALTRERSIKVVDLRQLRDESKGVLGSHTGRHPGIISKLLASRAGRFYLNDEYKFIRECVERGERVLLLAFCVSNRHRSVAFATCMGAAFWPMPVMVIHLDTYVDNNWQTMRCGFNPPPLQRRCIIR